MEENTSTEQPRKPKKAKVKAEEQKVTVVEEPKPEIMEDEKPLLSPGAWKAVAVISVILLVISVFTGGFKFEKALSKEQVEEKVLAFVKSSFPSDIPISLVESKDAGNLYNLKLRIAGQELDTYVTKDGKLLFPQIVNLEETATKERPANVPSKAEFSINENDIVLGNNDAPVTIVEFYEFLCPFCGAAAGLNEDVIANLKSRDPTWTAPLPEIKKKYVDNGDVKLVLKYFLVHEGAEKAYQMALCANEQGKFWEMHDKLYASDKDLKDTEVLKQLGAEAGADSAKLEECYNSGKYGARAAADTEEGRKVGVTGTPAFFVNSKLISGAASFSSFKELIDSQLPAKAAEVMAAEPVYQTIEVNAKRYRFVPNEIKVTTGTKVKMSIKSEDVDFGFIVPEFNAETTLKTGETASLEFVASKTGRFDFTCKDCDGKESIMKGTLIVE